MTWYNNEHKHSGICFLSQSERHDGRAEEILKNRRKVYMEAKLRNPERWSRGIKKWDLDKEVWLNPKRSEMIEEGDEELNKIS